MTTTRARFTPRLSHTRAAAVAALAAATALLVPASPAAGARSEAVAVTPPSTAPELATMAVAAEDFAPGAVVHRQRYVRAEKPFTVSYVREFKEGTTYLGGKRFAFVESDVDLAGTAPVAEVLYTLLVLFSITIDADQLADVFRAQGLKVRYVKIGAPVRLGLGAQSFAVMYRVGTTAGELRFLVSAVRVDRVIATTVAMGMPRAKVGPPEMKALLKRVTPRIVAGLKPVARIAPAVTGTAVVGQTLTTSRGAWRNKPSRFSFSWNRCDAGSDHPACAAIPGATAPTYTLVAADQGQAIRVIVTATNARGPGFGVSLPTLAVAPGPGAPASTVPPAISGTAAVGQTLTADPGTWSGSPAFVYTWYRCDAGGSLCLGNPIGTGQTYTLAAADAGSRIKVRVTATNASGWATVESPLTAVVSP